jgi:hypothetical protein
MSAIPSKELALQMCAEIREENRDKWFSAARWQCWGCMTFTGGDPEKMCIGGEEGCNLVNAHYARQTQGETRHA